MALQSYWIESKKIIRPKKLEDELSSIAIEQGAMCGIELDEENNRAQLTTSSAKLIEALRQNMNYKVTKVAVES
jgi:hypothetical protein